MARTTKQHYELFKKECLYWMDRFQLNDYEVYFEQKEMPDSLARSIIRDQGTVLFSLASEMNDFGDGLIKQIKDSAKHEVVHCLLGRYTIMAEQRYTREEELTNELEHLIRKLVNIIK